MANTKLTIPRQIIRPSRLQAGFFVIGCGLSSMTGAFATALLMAPRAQQDVRLDDDIGSMEYPSAEYNTITVPLSPEQCPGIVEVTLR